MEDSQYIGTDRFWLCFLCVSTGDETFKCFRPCIQKPLDALDLRCNCGRKWRIRESAVAIAMWLKNMVGVGNDVV